MDKAAKEPAYSARFCVLSHLFGGSRVASSPAIRLGVDIGGTFTDVALEVGDRRYTAKGLTTARAPETGVLTIVRAITAEAGIKPGDVQLIIHGTTLAT